MTVYSKGIAKKKSEKKIVLVAMPFGEQLHAISVTPYVRGRGSNAGNLVHRDMLDDGGRVIGVRIDSNDDSGFWLEVLFPKTSQTKDTVVKNDEDGDEDDDDDEDDDEEEEKKEDEEPERLYLRDNPQKAWRLRQSGDRQLKMDKEHCYVEKKRKRDIDPDDNDETFDYELQLVAKIDVPPDIFDVCV